MFLTLIVPLLSTILFPVLPERLIESHTKTDTVSIRTVCSCVAYIHSLGADIPLVNASELKVSTTTPHVGGVALFYYPNSGLHHVSLVTNVYEDSFDVIEANYDRCATGTRHVLNTDKRLFGFI